MRIDWVPASAALLVTGAMALVLASIVSVTGGEGADTVGLVARNDGRWLAASGIYFLSSVALVLGLPSILVLFQRRGQVLALMAGILLLIGFLCTAGYAMLLAMFRAMVLSDAIRSGGVDEIASDPGLAVFLTSWIAAFLLGEVVLAVALLRAGRSAAPVWVPVLLVVHPVLALVGPALLPDEVSRLTVLLLAGAFAGLAIRSGMPDAVRR